jgi:hypothetical protein
MTTMKTPGVYIVEKNAFPNAVVEAAALLWQAKFARNVARDRASK